jgi:sugar phosphate isomerase/epimerase
MNMKIGIYSVTYLGIWYRGPAMTLPDFMKFAKKEGWEGVELDTKRPHASPMDLGAQARKDLRGLAADLGLPISAVSPNCDLASPVPEHREAMLSYVRECIRLAADLGSPICKIFASWRGIVVTDGMGSYQPTRDDRYPEWAGERRKYLAESLGELSGVAGEHGVTLALQNHAPVVNNYLDVLALIRETGSPWLKACMDIPNEGENASSPEWARKVVAATGPLQVHSHYGAELMRGAGGKVELKWDTAWDYPKYRFAYPEYVEALVKSGYKGFMNWEYCHPAVRDGKPAGIDYVHEQTRMALEYMREIRSRAGGG